MSGSWFFNLLSKTYSDGLYYMFACFGACLNCFLIGFILVPRMGEFLGKLSVADAMGELYGSTVRVITAIAATIGETGRIAV